MPFAYAEYAVKRKQSRKEMFLIEMDRVVPLIGLIALIEPHYPKAKGGRPVHPLIAMLLVQLIQNWFGYRGSVMGEFFYETTLLSQLAGPRLDRIPDETTFLNFRCLLEKARFSHWYFLRDQWLSQRTWLGTAKRYHRRYDSD